FPAWRRTRTRRDQRLLDDLMAGERTQEVSQRHGLSPARVSQLRRDFHDDWRRFTSHDEPGVATRPTALVRSHFGRGSSGAALPFPSPGPRRTLLVLVQSAILP